MTSPRERTVDLVELDFIKNRARLLEVAAFLDRVERAGQEDDFRVRALRRAIDRLDEAGGQRATAILNELSDDTTAPLDKAPDGGARGACEVCRK